MIELTVKEEYTDKLREFVKEQLTDDFMMKLFESFWEAWMKQSRGY